jgi:tRNA A-37 threonylcarbamoyl transferase component Bud32
MADLIGTTLGPYRVLEQIGLGGMATVYKAYQPGMDRLVALKILPSHYAQDPLFVQRFEREARVIANLEHPGIIPIYDFGAHDGVSYLVMRYLQAGTVKDILERGRLPLADAAKLTNEIAAALDYAHSQGIIHRDVKPSNILVDKQGNAYLTDFGIAKVLEGTSELTGSAMLGTPAYMAPEQTLSKPVTPQTDVYSLGVMLYEMVTGKPPFEAETPMAVALMHINESLPLPRQVNPSLPEAVDLAILKALAKEPGDRFETAGELAKAFASAAYVEANAPVNRLTELANQAAVGKGSDELTYGVRAEILKQERREIAEKTRRWLPGVVAGLLAVVTLLGMFILSREASTLQGDSAATASAATESFAQLAAAQTAMMEEDVKSQGTLNALATRVAAASATHTATTANTSTLTATRTVTPSWTPTATQTATSSPTTLPTIPATATATTIAVGNADVTSGGRLNTVLVSDTQTASSSDNPDKVLEVKVVEEGPNLLTLSVSYSVTSAAYGRLQFRIELPGDDIVNTGGFLFLSTGNLMVRSFSSRF